MKIALFDFQKDTLLQLRKKVETIRKLVKLDEPQAIVFSAPTGSGKTIVMTALFEAILAEPDEQLGWPEDWEPQKDAVILWVSDMPELNEQTRLKIERQSDRISRASQIVTIDSTFDEEVLQGGRVYFINTQKLGNDKLLTKVGDGRQYSIWQTLTNTTITIPTKFYVVIDEAHRGMSGGRSLKEAQSLMQRFIFGYPEVGLVRMPVIIGISATPKRFTDVFDRAPDYLVHKVAISPESVRQSGLLKDRVLLYYPKTKSRSAMTLLGEAARRWSELSEDWQSYCEAESEKRVWPVLVVQVENAPSTIGVTSSTRTDLFEVLETIETAIGRRLGESEVVHAFHDSGDIAVGTHLIRKEEAARIDENTNIGVVLFKTSLSTGWDCPRAEVMMSFRHAEDNTYIAQLLGRMVRTPLARRIQSRAELNDVHLFLPYFDAASVSEVVKALKESEDGIPEPGPGTDLVVLRRRKETETIFAVLEELLTYRVNAPRVQSSLRRYMAISTALTMDGIMPEVLDEAKTNICRWVACAIRKLQDAGVYETAARRIIQVDLKTHVLLNDGNTLDLTDLDSVELSDLDLTRAFETAGRNLGFGLHLDYLRYRDELEPIESKVEIIVLVGTSEAMRSLESQAKTEFDQLYDRYKKDFGRLPEHRRSVYDRLRLATAEPSTVPWRLPDSIDFVSPPKAPEWDRHLYVEENGNFRADLGSWEAEVLKEELKNKEVVGWLRNLDRKSWSLEIPYETGGTILPMFPDLVIVRKVGQEFVVDILEPHNPSLADNFEKTKGLARFAERHGHLFGRIQLLRKQTTGGNPYFARLDINKEAMRKKLLGLTSNANLDALF